jgi:hypothetical protein
MACCSGCQEHGMCTSEKWALTGILVAFVVLVIVAFN